MSVPAYNVLRCTHQLGRLLRRSTAAARMSYNTPSLQSVTFGIRSYQGGIRTFSVGPNDDDVTKDSSSSSVDTHRMFEEQMMEIQEEREALYGFTEEEQSAWAQSGNPAQQKHDAAFLQQLQEARDALELERDTSNIKGERPNPSQTASVPPNGGHTLATDVQPHTLTLTHLTPDGASVQMVDVGGKEVTQRRAVAQSRVVFPDAVVQAFHQHSNSDWIGPKGPIFATAKVAGIMAAKSTSQLIPLCHPLPLDQVSIEINYDASSRTAVIRCECRVSHNTGVEMEALTGASVAALTIYDMVKAVSHDVRIQETVLVQKSGGKRSIG